MERMEMALWLAWLTSAVIALGIGGFWPIVGAILILPALFFLLCWPSTIQRHSGENELKRENFPMLFQMLDGERAFFNHDRKTRVFLCEDGAGAFEGLGYDGILISPLLLAILTRDELRQVLRHELAHLSGPAVRREIRWQRLSGRVVQANRCTLCMLPILNPILYIVGLSFVRRQREYQRIMAPVREREADAQLDPVPAAAAIIKAEFAYRIAEKMGKKRFKNLADLREFCWQKIDQDGKGWMEEMENRHDADVHPCFQARVQAKCSPFQREASLEWVREMNEIKNL